MLAYMGKHDLIIHFKRLNVGRVSAAHPTMQTPINIYSRNSLRLRKGYWTYPDRLYHHYKYSLSIFFNRFH